MPYQVCSLVGEVCAFHFLWQLCTSKAEMKCNPCNAQLWQAFQFKGDTCSLPNAPQYGILYIKGSMGSDVRTLDRLWNSRGTGNVYSRDDHMIWLRPPISTLHALNIKRCVYASTSKHTHTHTHLLNKKLMSYKNLIIKTWISWSRNVPRLHTAAVLQSPHYLFNMQHRNAGNII